MPPYITAFILTLSSLDVYLSNIHAIFRFVGTDRAKLCMERYHRV